MAMEGNGAAAAGAAGPAPTAAADPPSQPSSRDAFNRAAFAASIFKRGQKAELFGEGAQQDEAAELAGKLDELRSVWALERSGHGLSAAIWRPHLGVAEVVLQTGKVLAHMGFTRGKKLYLFIEEALYLMDRANLLLFLDTTPASPEQPQGAPQRLLSLQEAAELMAGLGVPTARYLVLCKLLRAGYIVQRHPSRWALANDAELAEVPVAAAAWGQTGGGSAAAGQQGAADRQQGAAERQQGAAPASASEAAPQQPAAASLPAGPARKKRKLGGGPQQQQLAGRGWWVSSAAQAGSAGEAAGSEQAAGDEAGGAEPAGSSARPANPWACCLAPAFLESLPRCEVLAPATQRAAADFPRMAPLQPIPLHDLQLAGGAEAGRSLLHYDVYQSNARFSRRQPGTPAFVVSVLPCTTPPTPDLMAAADAAAGGIPVRFSTVEKGDICFYGAAHVELRSIL